MSQFMTSEEIIRQVQRNSLKLLLFGMLFGFIVSFPIAFGVFAALQP